MSGLLRASFALTLAALCAGCVARQMHDTASVQPMEAQPVPPSAGVPREPVMEDWPPPASDAALRAAEATGDSRYRATRVPTPEAAARRRSPLSAAEVDRAAAERMFAQQCSHCHGERGRGDGPVGGYFLPRPPDLTHPDIQRHSEGALMWRISVGIGRMPAFAPKLRERDRWLLVAHLRSLPAEPTTRDPPTD